MEQLHFIITKISKLPGRLPIHRIEVEYRFFVHPSINKTNRIKENNIFLKHLFFCHGVDLFRNGPRAASVGFSKFSQIFLRHYKFDLLNFKAVIFILQNTPTAKCRWLFLQKRSIQGCFISQDQARILTVKPPKISQWAYIFQRVLQVDLRFGTLFSEGNGGSYKQSYKN